MNPTKLLLGLLAPVLAAASAWLAGAVGKYGLHLDVSGINALATAAAAGMIALTVKLIHDVEAKHPTIATDLQTITTAAAPELTNAWPATTAPAPAPPQPAAPAPPFTQ